MSYINDYSREINTEQTGEVISGDLSRVITLYVRAYRGEDDDPKINVHKGDPVFVDSRLPDEEYNGAVIAYVPTHDYGEHPPTNIAGIALAEPQYPKADSRISSPFPIAIAGEVIATVFAEIIEQRGDVDAKGRYYTGEYIAADGTPSTSPEWFAGRKLMLGQIIAPKTDKGTDAINTRVYPRVGDDSDREYYHMPIRLMCGQVSPGGGVVDASATIMALNRNPEDEEGSNDPGDVYAYTPVAIVRYLDGIRWKWGFTTPKGGQLANGVALEHIKRGRSGKVLVAGQVIYTYEEVYSIVASSPRAKLTPFGARIIAAHAMNANDDILDGYYTGMRVTDDMIPIETSVPGNLFGQITDIDHDAQTVTVSLDPVATHAPANTAEAIIDSESINEDTPVGAALIENPITHALVPCRFDTDNVDGVLMPATPLPTVNGWTLQDYRAVYGSSVFMAPDGSFWSGLKAFAKGVYQRVLKPVAKWAISVVTPVAASYVGPLGNVLASHVSTKCGQLLDRISPTPPNGKYTYTNVFGQLREDEDTLNVYTDNCNSYDDNHPNATYVYDIATPTENTTWALGDCLAVNADTGMAEKISSYETPIEAVVNFEPAQDPETNGWKIAGIARGHTEIRSNALKVGMPVLYDGTDATSRLAAGNATAIIGRVREVWQPSEATLAAVRAGRLPADEELPNCIVEVAPEYHYAANAMQKKISTVMFEGTPNANGGQA